MAKYPPLTDQPCAHCGTIIRRRVLRSGRVFCNMKCKAEWQRSQKPVGREQLYEWYVVQGKSANEIARIVGRNSKRVWEWLRDYGIQTRPRGSNERVYFKKGHTLSRGRKHSKESRERLSRIAKEQGRVPYDPAVGSYMKGRRGTDTPNWKGGVTPERQQFYFTPQWKRAVRAVWKRADARCERCGHDFRTHTRRHAIHHVYPFAEYRHLRANPDALVLLCRECHLFVHSKRNVNLEFMLKEMELPEWLQPV